MSVSVPFEELYRSHFAFVWRALRRLGVREADVPDAVQDVFLIAHRKLEELDPGTRLSTWLYAVAMRVASERRRRASARREVMEAPPELAATDPDAARALELRERRRLLDQALDGLPMEQRAVFTLFELDGWSGEHIAELLAIPLPTVHSRLRLARAAFRKVLERARQREAIELRRIEGAP